MKRFIFGFILGIALTHVSGVKAQENHPLHDLSLREVLDVLGEFDIRHIDQPPFSMPAYGVTVFDINPPTIFIFNVADSRSKKSTLVHEFIHVHCRNVGVECTDEHVRAEEDRQYQKIFGVGVD